MDTVIPLCLIMAVLISGGKKTRMEGEVDGNVASSWFGDY